MPKLPLLLALVALTAGCGSGDDRDTTPAVTSSPASGATSPTDETIAIEGFKFLPEDAAVAVGTTVTWTNEDAAPHTATADDESFDTGTLRDGDSGEVTFRKAGSFTYFCEFHKFMRATIVVR